MMAKIKHKSKIHPSPPAASLQNAAPTGSEDSLSVLNLLPAAILALAAVLSLQDREVLAYMITRSLKTATSTSPINSSSSSVHDSKKLYGKQPKTIVGGGGIGIHHRLPVFDCDCFDCYTSFWYRWDSSPNRELIHQAIEAFEAHLPSGDVKTKRTSSRRSRKKEKLPVPKLEKEIRAPPPVVESEAIDLQVEEIPADNDGNLTPVAAAAEEEPVASGQKVFARKVLPEVLGVLNSCLWNIWGPNA